MLCGYDVIPEKFHKYAGVRNYQFKIRNGFPYQNIDDQKGWFCEVDRDSRWVEICLPLDKFPHEIEILASLAKIDGECEREYRYIRIHSAYESVISNKNIDFSAVRHALAHSIAILTRKNVRDSLTQRFGGLRIDLHNYHHQKEAYRCIGQMLIAIDQEIHR
jgi:hypothetical protein